MKFYPYAYRGNSILPIPITSLFSVSRKEQDSEVSV